MREKAILIVLSSLILLLCAGCGSEEDPAGPDDSNGGGNPGTIDIDAEPDMLDAPWTITGPGDYSGNGVGDSILTDMAPGTYTINWGAVSGWTPPAGEALGLASDGTLIFSGFYTEEGFAPAGFVLIPSSTFIMGTPINELGSYLDERPQHAVTFVHDFYIQVTEVTNQQYLELAQWAVDHGMATLTDTILYDNLDFSEEPLLYLNQPSSQITVSGGKLVLVESGGETRPDHPVRWVTWYGAATYCDWLTKKHGMLKAYDHSTWACNDNDPHSAHGYRLPTEAEWEYACRAGSSTAFANGPITERFCRLDPALDEIGWYCGNTHDPYYNGHRVAQKIPNAWGLYDMHGNNWEWCNDWYREYYYAACGDTIVDPVGPITGYTRRVHRGGNWQHGADICRSGDRSCNFPTTAQRYLGFRPIKSKLLAEPPGGY